MSNSEAMLKAFLELHSPLKDYGKMRWIQDAWKARDDEIEALRQELVAMTKENERLQGVCHDYRTTQETLVGQLAASQDREAKLRERMTRARGILTKDNPTPECNWGVLDVSSEHFDDTALQERLKQERERCEEAAIEAWKAGKDLAAAIRALT